MENVGNKEAPVAYSNEQVIELLKQQRSKCAGYMAWDSKIADAIMETELVIPTPTSIREGCVVRTKEDVYSHTEQVGKGDSKNLGKETYTVNKVKYWKQGEGNIVYGVKSDKRNHQVWHHENDLEIVSPSPTPTVRETPKVICFCGSTRFANEFMIQRWECEKRGIITFGINILPDNYFAEGNAHGAEQEGVKHVLDELHKRKIDLSDSVFVLNVGGYIGESTRNEINYAQSVGKPIVYLESPNSEQNVKVCDANEDAQGTESLANKNNLREAQKEAVEGVYSRPECIHVYCSQADYCKDNNACACPQSNQSK